MELAIKLMIARADAMQYWNSWESLLLLLFLSLNY